MAPGNTTTCLDEIWKEFPSYTQYQVRSALAKCGLTTKHIESQVRVLSGGEQAKVRLCKLINRETNVLLLDEPTNHLDVDAKEELKRALKAYKGSILLICHEPDFMKVWLQMYGTAETGHCVYHDLTMIIEGCFQIIYYESPGRQPRMSHACMSEFTGIGRASRYEQGAR